MRYKLALIVAIVVMAIMMPVASASTITFSDPLESGQKLLVYQVNGNGTVLIGEYNLTDSINVSGDNYVMTLKPGGAGLIQNPTVAFDWLQAGILIVFCIIFGAGLTIGVGRILMSAFRIK